MKTEGNMRRFEDMVGGRPEVALLGFGLYWFWVFVLFDSGANASTVAGISAPLFLHIVSLSVSALAFLLVAFKGALFERLFWNRWFVLASVFLALVGTVFALLPTLSSSLPFVAIAGVLNGIASPWFCVSWGVLYANVRPHEAFVYLASSFFVGTFLSFLTTWVPAPLVVVVGSIALLGACLLAMLCHRALSDRVQAATRDGALKGERGAKGIRGLLPAKVVVGIVVVLFVYAVGRSIIFQSPAYSFNMHVPMLAVAAVALIVATVFRVRRIHVGQLYRFAMPLVAIASTLIAFSYVDFVSQAAILEAASICTIEIATWVLLVNLAHERPERAVALIALGRCAVHGGSALGEIAGLYLVAHHLLFLIVAVVCLVVVAGFSFSNKAFVIEVGDGDEAAFGPTAGQDASARRLASTGASEPSFDRDGERSDAPQEGRFLTSVDDQALRLFAEEHGLSVRETGVLRLWVMGYSGTAIENELTISKSTVKTHIKHIYEKTGAHSRSDLIGMLMGAA